MSKRQNQFQKFTKGAQLFCDFTFGGKPHAKCLEVITPGKGKDIAGLLRVELTEAAGAYKKGEILEVSTYTGVPVKMKLPLKRGQFFRRVSTLYTWE